MPSIKWRVLSAVAAIAVAGAAVAADSGKITPEQDRKAFQQFFMKKFPAVEFEDFVNGSYALDEDMRAQWKSLMQFPPFEFAVDRGKELFETTEFPDGKGYADCFDNGGTGIRQNYPYFDKETDEVITLELAINRCRQAHGAEPLAYKKGALAKISAYMASTSRGNTIDIEIPDDPAALQAYQAGKEYYYTRRGQLNFSCASCHVQNPGERIRAQLLSPALGQVANFPVHRSKWGELGTLHRRFTGCNRNIRAKPLPAQSEQYRNLEYFLTYMSNGLPVSGPNSRQ